MALLNPDKKKEGILEPREKMGMAENISNRASKVAQKVEGTPLGTPQSPVVETDKAAAGVADMGSPIVKKPKVKKKEVGVGAYQA